MNPLMTTLTKLQKATEQRASSAGKEVTSFDRRTGGRLHILSPLCSNRSGINSTPCNREMWSSRNGWTSEP